ncbi:MULTISPECIES: M16 family metallopeptidase [Xanthobacter]|uniref:Pitrilysin family protein n=1 Tax=Xanthobacter aminoxidans TaxID=186280 RepID=A0ABW6ZMW6_9HYPH|nr:MULTISPECIES: pitrilysin family protein [Xanthobacter]MCL8381263.1 insulinase family protein [Xanthobacter aminoxidans]
MPKDRHVQMSRLAMVAILAAGAAAFSPRLADAAGPEVTEFKLANGLQVMVIPDHRTPVVTHMVWYKVGSADEQPGKSGIAHFLEHLMFKGTDAHPQGQFSAEVARLGGQENAFTSQDYTAYFQRVAKEHLETVMGFEADRMRGLKLSDEVVLPERDVVLEERRMRTDNDPGARLSEVLQATTYVNHPYQHPIIGWEHEIKGLNREDALAFYRRFYAPNNALLVVAGDVDPAEVKALAEKTYGKVAQADTPPRNRPQEPEPRAHRRVSLADPRVAQPSLQRSYLVPSARTAAPGDAEALEVLSHILGGGQTSRMYRTLVAEKGLAAGAGSWYQGTAYDATRFVAYASPRPGVSLETLEAAVDAVVAELQEKGVDDLELARAKTRLIADTIYAQDNQATLARIYGASWATGLSAKDVREWPERLKAVTADQVRDVARRYLVTDRAVTGYLKQTEPKAGDAGKADGKKDNRS